VRVWYIDANPDLIAAKNKTAPKALSVEMVREFLKYDSGTKSFKTLESKSFSISTDAVVLQPLKAVSTAVSRLY